MDEVKGREEMVVVGRERSSCLRVLDVLVKSVLDFDAAAHCLHMLDCAERIELRSGAAMVDGDVNVESVDGLIDDQTMRLGGCLRLRTVCQDLQLLLLPPMAGMIALDAKRQKQIVFVSWY